MTKGIIILGPAGAGKTTLGKLVARELGIAFLDIDDYIWRWDTEIPYTVLCSRQERIDNLMAAVEKAGTFVMAGSMNSFHTHFDPFFCLAVYLTARTELRVERAHRRELEAFGSRALPGGDMYEAHQAFLADVAGYDSGTVSPKREQHEAWLGGLTCPVLRLDGGDALEKNRKIIVEAYGKQTRWQVRNGETRDLNAWMALVEAVRWNFPGLETPEALAEHRQTVLRFMADRRALCVWDQGRVVGVLLFSRKRRMICCLAVLPDYRRRGIGGALLSEALSRLGTAGDVTVTTFRAGDEKGTAPRTLYRRFGFAEGKLDAAFGYPVQEWIRKGIPEKQQEE